MICEHVRGVLLLVTEAKQKNYGNCSTFDAIVTINWHCNHPASYIVRNYVGALTENYCTFYTGTS
jgi:hypothetical protein